MGTVGRHGVVGRSPSSRLTCLVCGVAFFVVASRHFASHGLGSRSHENANVGLSCRLVFVSSSTAGRRCLLGLSEVVAIETRSATTTFAFIAGRCVVGPMFMSASMDETSTTSTPTTAIAEMSIATSLNVATRTTSPNATTTSSRQKVGLGTNPTTTNVSIGAVDAGRPCRSACKNVA